SRIGADSFQYHFVVLSNGEIWQTRNLEFIAWHIGNAEGNERSIGIHLPLGTGQAPTAAQWEATKRLIEALRADYGLSRQQVVGHCEWPRERGHAQPSATYRVLPLQSACPGSVLHAKLVEYRAIVDDGLTVVAAPRFSEARFSEVLRAAGSPAAPDAHQL